MTKGLVILGAQKTGTSTMMGILNCHPDILVTPEFFIDRKVSTDGQEFLQEMYISPGCWPDRYSKFPNFIQHLSGYFKAEGLEYAYLGDKWPKLGRRKWLDIRCEQFEGCHVIFMVRDIRTWLAKQRVSEMYKIDSNVVEIVAQYVYYFLISLLRLDKCLHVRMEDLLKHDFILGSLSDFLELDMREHADEWWDKIPRQLDYYKSSCIWWAKHKSSLVKPSALDVNVEIAENKMWKIVLPIFDRYYNSLDKRPNRAQLKKDIDTIRSLVDIGTVPLDTCFTTITEVKI